MLERIKKLLSHLCFFNTLLLFMWHWRSKLFKSRVPDLWDLMPDDLKWSWCNNNRNKACNKRNALESSQNHPPPPPVHGKIVLYEISPGAKKVGDHWFKCFKETFKSANYARSIYLAVCVCVYLCYAVLSCFSCVQLLLTLWTAALQAPLTMDFSRQEYCSELPCPPPGRLLDPGIKLVSHCVSCVGRQILYH